MNIYISDKDIEEYPYEFVERKGVGHPDTLADALAEHLSARYSRYTRDRFGAVLHHNFDKLGLLGGSSDVGFGHGKLTQPIRVLLNGRASTRFSDSVIPLRELLIEWTKEFFKVSLPLIDVENDLEFHYNQSYQSSPGKTKEGDNNGSSRGYWFEPRGLQDIPELEKLFSNDTSMGVGFAPFSKLESLVLNIERYLNSDQYRKRSPWIGSDIKIMGFRHQSDYRITMCIPQISSLVFSAEEYRKNLDLVKSEILKIATQFDIKNLELDINTRDSYDKGEFYLTATGSSIESGDEGLVGRGNRIQGIISPTRLMSMEGAAGKNPIYHIGKIYYLAAQKISESIFDKYGVSNEVVLISQSGRDLLDPWVVFVRVSSKFNIDRNELENHVKEWIEKIPSLSEDLIYERVSIF